MVVRNKPIRYTTSWKAEGSSLYGLVSNLLAWWRSNTRSRGLAGSVKLLERRLDNVVYRSGFAVSRRAARQLVSHGHFELNGRRVDIPSIRVKAGDVMRISSKEHKSEYFTRIDTM